MLSLRPFLGGEEAALQELLESEQGYTERVTGYPPGASDALSLMIARPPDTPSENKVVLGAWRDDKLIGVVDLIRGYPDEQTAWIGLLLVRPTEQGLGIGRQIHGSVEDIVAGWPGISRFRLAVVDTNAELATPFWTALGYSFTGQTKPYRYDNLESLSRIYERPLRTVAIGGAQRPSDK